MKTITAVVSKPKCPVDPFEVLNILMAPLLFKVFYGLSLKWHIFPMDKILIFNLEEISPKYKENKAKSSM